MTTLTPARVEHLKKLAYKWGFLERKKAEYNTDTLARVRRLARKGWAAGAIASMLGWDLCRLKAFCDRHHVTFVPIVAVSRTPDPKAAGIRCDGRYAWHRSRHVPLPAVECRMLRALLAAPDDFQWTAEKMAEAIKIPKRSVYSHMSMLRSSLEEIGLVLTRRTYELSRL